MHPGSDLVGSTSAVSACWTCCSDPALAVMTATTGKSAMGSSLSPPATSLWQGQPIAGQEKRSFGDLAARSVAVMGIDTSGPAQAAWLGRLQEEAVSQAGKVASAYPPERRMTGAQLDGYLGRRTYALASTTRRAGAVLPVRGGVLAAHAGRGGPAGQRERLRVQGE